MSFWRLSLCAALVAACYQTPALTNGSIRCGGVDGDCPSGYTCGCDGLCRATASTLKAPPEPLPPPVERAVWDKLSGIGHRAEPSVEYDPVRHEVVLFSGDGTDGAGGDTWTWNGSRWSWRSDAGPSSRKGAATAFDHARGELVVFGGLCYYGCESAETWLWDGVQWRQAAANGPKARLRAAMADDEAHGQLVLFGGTISRSVTGPPGNDLWAWNGSAWSNLCASVACAVSSPAPRSEHALAYDRKRQRIVMFGGLDGSNAVLGDIWEWDGTSWTQLCTSAACSTNAPGARSGHAMYYDPVREKTVVVGGYNTTYLDDVWEWDGAAWSLSTEPRPPARYMPRVTFDEARGVPVMYGGFSSSAYLEEVDTLERGPTGWVRVDDGSPGYAYTPGVTYDTARAAVQVYSGNGDTDDYVWEWTKDGHYVRSCDGANCDKRGSRIGAMAYDQARAETVQITTSATRELWAWKNGAWTGKCTAAAPCNASVPSGQAVAYDAKRAVVVIAGGAANEVWEWDGAALTQKCTDTTCTSNRPPPPGFGTLTYDPVREVILHYASNKTTWTWDGTAWTQLCMTSPCADVTPGPRIGYSITWNAARDTALLFGGYSSADGELADVWEWSGSAWKKLADGGPLPREEGGFAFDVARGRAVLFGGRSDEGTYWLGDTWEFHVRGGACSTGAECDSGFCTDGVCCDQPACGTCAACNVGIDAGRCVPLVDRDDPDTCAGVQTCGATSTCGLAAGQPCTNDAECASARCNTDPCDQVCL